MVAVWSSEISRGFVWKKLPEGLPSSHINSIQFSESLISWIYKIIHCNFAGLPIWLPKWLVFFSYLKIGFYSILGASITCGLLLQKAHSLSKTMLCTNLCPTSSSLCGPSRYETSHIFIFFPNKMHFVKSWSKSVTFRQCRYLNYWYFHLLWMPPS